MMIEPHGGTLVNRVVPAEEREAARARAQEVPQLSVSLETVRCVENIARGAFSPLEGFLTRGQLEGVVYKRRLPRGEAWTLPITLDTDEATAQSLKEDSEMALTYEGQPVALLHLQEKFSFDKKEMAQHVFATTEEKHPGVANLYASGSVFLGGTVRLIEDTGEPYPEVNLPPAKTRALFEQRGWKTVAAFQTRNVPHAGHEHMQKIVISMVDGLLIQPVIGKKKPGDFRDDMIIKAYQTIIANYFPSARVFLNILPFDMRYAGPREAIFHAIVRKNYGCTHMIVGRDHAGVGNYYHPEAAIEIFEQFPDLGIKPITIRGDYFYCHKCLALGSERICPHDKSEGISFSGTEIRKLITEGGTPSPHIMRPEVFEVLKAAGNPFVQ
jgi:sulfate adenylyltransferase